MAERAYFSHGGRTGRKCVSYCKARPVEGNEQEWAAAEEEAFKQPIRQQYETQGHPYYASARLWDDGVIDPAQTRRVLSLCLAAARHAPAQDTRFGVFRM